MGTNDKGLSESAEGLFKKLLHCGFFSASQFAWGDNNIQLEFVNTNVHNRGGVAQMVERSLSMQEVPGSIPGASKIVLKGTSSRSIHKSHQHDKGAGGRSQKLRNC